MKRIIKIFALVMALIMAALSLAACGKKPAAEPKQTKDDASAWLSPVEIPEDAVLPPSQIGAGSTEASYKKLYSIDMAFEEAEAVCIVTIGNWLGENDTCTYFEAFVNKVYKGTLPDKIALYQLGNKDFTVKYSPLFTYGDRLLVCLRSTSRDDGLNIENIYEPVGADTAFFYLANDAEGRTFLIDHRGLLSYTTLSNDPELSFTNYALDLSLRDGLISNIASCDKAIGEYLRLYAEGTDSGYSEGQNSKFYIYSLEEIEAHFADLNGI